ncbi:hypothetical protein DESC_160026 [Desulfosarcina cetonica]|nr:hypothetical protein DESC_160026 [Desulfosarcina cetonica]
MDYSPFVCAASCGCMIVPNHFNSGGESHANDRAESLEEDDFHSCWPYRDRRADEWVRKFVQGRSHPGKS